MSQLKERFALNSIRSKLIFAFLIACAAILFSWISIRAAFSETLERVEKMSAPNEKLRVVNGLFAGINQLGQLKRLQAVLQDAGPKDSLLSESDQVFRALDTLAQLCENDTVQLQRIVYMKKLLGQHEQLFSNYLALRSDVIGKKTLSKKMRELSGYISANAGKGDSSVVTTEKKTTVTTVTRSPTEQPRQESFFRRLFGRKHAKQAPSVKQQVKEDISVKVDTLAMAQRDSVIRKIEVTIDNIEKDEASRGSKLLLREFQLVSSGNALINQLLQILRDVESEEMLTVKSNNEYVADVFNESIRNISYIVLGSFLVTALLLFLIFTDIARSSTYRQQLLEAKEEAERLSMVKQRFLANMSHEIRTPLQSILGFAEQVQQQAHPKREDLEAIHRSSEHLLQIVNEVLDYSRIVSGKFSFEAQPFDMNALLAEVAGSMVFQAGRKQIQFRFDPGPALKHAYKGDAFRLKQILYNLLGNAIKFTEKGSVSLEVETQDLPKKTEFSFRISDTGVGLSDEDINRIFQVFEQASTGAQRAHEGTGLGLSIVKSLVELQGGTISVESSVGKGSVFTVRLTYAKLPATALAGPAQTSNLEPVSYKGHVVVVDDDEFILKLCRAILDKHQVHHRCFSSPVSFLESAWNTDTSLVLLDIRMPGMNGTELCRLLRSRYGRELRIMALTAQSFPEEKEAILREGFDGIVLKPFREHELLAVLSEQQHPERTTMASTSTTLVEMDLSAIEHMSMNDAGLLRDNLSFFIEDTLNDLDLLGQALEARHQKEVAGYVHKLAGKTGQAGSLKLAEQCREMERKLETEGTLTQYEEEIRSMVEQIVILTEQIRVYIED